MADVTQILSQIEQGDPSAADQLLPLVYDELRRLAVAKMSQENSDNTLQATALVHEAYLRLVDVDQAQCWNSRGHFFAAAAEAMRRILVESARRKKSLRLGGELRRVETELDHLDAPHQSPDVLIVDEALDKLAAADPQTARLVQLRYFGGLTLEQAAAALGISARTADRYWVYAKAWLHQEIDNGQRR